MDKRQQKIEKLISELCPNGVEFLDIERLWIKAPKSKLGVAQVKELSEGNIICFTSGKNVFYVNDYLVDGEYIFMNDGGSADTKYNKGKAYYTDHTFTFTVNENKLLPKFTYYFLKENEIYINDILFKGTGLKNLNKKAFAKIKIPVPPLAIQEEIVKILDNFTELEADLEAELEERKVQYMYYKKKLLTSIDKKNVYKKLGEVVNILDNQRKPIAKSKREVGDIPYYGANGIQSYTKDYIFDGTFLLMGEDGSVINKDGSPVLNWATGKIWVNNHAHVLSEIKNLVLLRFIYFYLQIVDVTKIVRGTPPKINQQNLRNILIPIPPISEQERIVSILDKFDALVNDISIGLPAELAARRQQYEYYRGKLLTFQPSDRNIQL